MTLDVRDMFGAAGMDETKEVKVRLPIAHLIKLHGLKLVAGHSISETVTRALDAYFAARDASESAAEAAVTATA